MTFSQSNHQKRFLSQTMMAGSQQQAQQQRKERTPSNMPSSTSNSHQVAKQTIGSAMNQKNNTIADKVGASTTGMRNRATTEAGKAAQSPGSALEFYGTSNAALIPAETSPLKSTLTQSQANLHQNALGSNKPNNSGKDSTLSASGIKGYQPSYLRELTTKNSQYSSQSPMKHQARLQQMSNSVKKYGQNFSSSKRHINDRVSNISNIKASASDSKNLQNSHRSGSQFVSAKKLFQGHQSSNSTSRGEYSGMGTQRNGQHLPVENSFTRLHKGNSSVVRTFERKQLLAQQQREIQRKPSTSQVRKLQEQFSSNSRINQQQTPSSSVNKTRNSNAIASNCNSNRGSIGQHQNQLFNTGINNNNNALIPNTSTTGLLNVQQTLSPQVPQPYQNQSNTMTGGDINGGNFHQPISVGQLGAQNPLYSDRTMDSGKGETGRNNNSNGGINRNKSHKQPRQSKSTANSNVNIQGNQSTSQPNQEHPAQFGLQTQPLTLQNDQNRLTALQSIDSTDQLDDSHNIPNGSGLETSLSFTRRLIEQTTANAKEENKNSGDSEGREKDIGQVSVSIYSNLNQCAAIETTTPTSKDRNISNNKLKLQLQQKFISPKFSKPNISASMRFGNSSLVSPTNAGRGPTTSIDKKLSQNTFRGSANKNSIQSKVPQSSASSHALAMAFSPDKRPNISRSQIQNNLYFKRGAKAGAPQNDKSQSREPPMRHQRMFGPTGNSNLTPGGKNSVSPAQKFGPTTSQGPSYMKNTFSRETKASSKTNKQSSVHSYQLNRVRPSKQKLTGAQSSQQNNISQSSILPQTGIIHQNSTSSLKELQGVRVLDQSTAANITSSQSQFPPRNQASATRQSQTMLKSNTASKTKNTATTTQQSNAMLLGFYPQPKIQNQRNTIQPTSKLLQRGQRPSSKRTDQRNENTQNTIKAYQKKNSNLVATQSGSANKQFKHSNTASRLPNESSNNGGTSRKSQGQDDFQQIQKQILQSQSEVQAPKRNSNNPLQKGQKTPVKSQLSFSASEIANANNPEAPSYKKKQDQIIEMIQSNMKRSEDIQQTLSSGKQLFQSVRKETESRKSSLSNNSDHKQDSNTKTESQIVDTEASGIFKQRSINASPKVAKDPQTLTDQNDRSGIQIGEPEAQVPLSSKVPVSPTMSMKDSLMAFQSRTGGGNEDPTNLRKSSTISQEESLQVEDVFNDSQLLQNRMKQDSEPKNILPEIIPAEQPNDNSSSENVFSENTSPRNRESLNDNNSGDQPNNQKTYQSTNQSAFAKALANKKQAKEEANTEMQPFGLFDSNTISGDNIGAGLEIVAEDMMEDRNSMTSSVRKSQITRPSTVFPMKKDAFVSLYKSLLTDQEKEELTSLDLTDGKVYYANDIPTRTSKAQAILNSDDEDGYYIIKAKDQLLYRFEVIKVLGKGSFAQVVSAIDHMTGKVVAVKINRNTEIDHKFAKQEGKLLKFLMDEDPQDEHNIVRMHEHINFRMHQCFVFELLNTDLFEHLKENEFLGFNENQIRSYAAQLLKALVFLEKRDVIHCDLKPENILCVDPARKFLKVVDFGSGCLTNEQVYTYVQSRYYRAPEVILRIPYSEKVDIWSLGCILAELFTGEPLFPGSNEQEQLEFIMELCGMFPESVIDKSRKKDHYFDTDYSPFLIEDPKQGIMRIPENRQMEEAIPSQDQLFLDFVAQCLTLDPDERPGAAEATQHPWLRGFFNEDGEDLINQNAGQHLLAGREFQLDDDQLEGDFVPLRRKRPSEFEQLDLNGNMQVDVPQTEEYCEGAVTESGRESTEAGMRQFDFEQDADGSDGAQTIKFAHSIVSQSRQREEAGARASATEISPERPIGSYLSGQQKMTSFTQVEQNAEAPGLVLHPMEVQSPETMAKQTGNTKLQKSPLKPSNESLLEHYKYEKQSKQGSAASNSYANLVAKGEGILNQYSSAKKKNPHSNSLVEEPKIISMTTSSFQKQ